MAEQSVTRQLILERIKAIKEQENGFPRGVQRWENFSNGTDTRHISVIDFEQLTDFELVFLFERLIRRYYTQM